MNNRLLLGEPRTFLGVRTSWSALVLQSREYKCGQGSTRWRLLLNVTFPLRKDIIICIVICCFGVTHWLYEKLIYASCNDWRGGCKGGTNTAKLHRYTYRHWNYPKISKYHKPLGFVKQSAIPQIKIKISAKTHQKLSKTTSPPTLMSPSSSLILFFL